MVLDSLFSLAAISNLWPSHARSASCLGSSRDGPLPFPETPSLVQTTMAGHWAEAAAAASLFSCLKFQLPQSSLHTAVKASAKNANLMVSWQLKASVTSQVRSSPMSLTRRDDNLFKFSSATSSSFLCSSVIPAS